MIVELLPLSLRSAVRAVREEQSRLGRLAQALAPRSPDGEVEALEVERWLFERQCHLDVVVHRALQRWRQGGLSAAGAAAIILAAADTGLASSGQRPRLPRGRTRRLRRIAAVS